MNKIILAGRLTADPDVKVTTDNTSVANFTLAVSRAFAEDKTDFVKIVAWSKLAEQASNHFKKGMLIIVEGRIQVRSFDDKEGETTWVTEVVTNHMRMLEKKKDGSAKASAPKESAKPAPSEDVMTEDDIPF